MIDSDAGMVDGWEELGMAVIEDEVEVEVVIVGGGRVGLTARALLGRAGHIGRADSARTARALVRTAGTDECGCI
jgi:hypothetical protein